MTSYHSNVSLAALNARVARDLEVYEDMVERRKEQRAVDLAEYEQRHAEWAATPESEGMATEPEPPPIPDPVPEPAPPDMTLPVFKARTISKPTMISTRHGDAMVTPPRVVLTDEEGFEFALSEAELAVDYTEVGS